MVGTVRVRIHHTGLTLHVVVERHPDVPTADGDPDLPAHGTHGKDELRLP